MKLRYFKVARQIIPVFLVVVIGLVSLSYAKQEQGPGTTSKIVADKIQKKVESLKASIAANNGTAKLSASIGDALQSYSGYMPDSLYNALMNTAATNLKVIEYPQMTSQEQAGYSSGAAMLRGVLNVNGSLMNFRILFFEDTGVASPVMATSLVLDMPNSWQLSTWFQDLKPMDKIKFEKSKFAIATAQYRDIELDIYLEYLNFTFIALINLSNQQMQEFQSLRTFIEKTNKKTVPYLLIQTSIPFRKPKEAKFDIVVPFTFEKTYKPGSSVTKIAADALIVSIQPIQLTLGLSMGMFLYLSSQPQPLRFTLAGTLSKTDVELEGYMEGVYDPAFGLDWLALGEFGLELDFNFALMAAGIPVSGIGFRGMMGLGEGTQRVNIEAAAKVEVNSDSVPGIGLQAKVNQIDIGALFSLLKKDSKKAGKNVDISNMPTIKFYDLGLRIMPQSMSIAGQTFRQGVTAEGFMDIFGLKGYAYVYVSPSTLTFTMKGGLAKIENEYFKISGPGLKDIPGMEEGPSTTIDVALLKPSPQLPSVIIGGDFEVKPIKWKTKVDLIASLKQIYAKAETTIGEGFGAGFELNVPFTDMKNFGIIFSMKLDFMNALKQKMQEYAKNKKIEIEKDYQKLDKKVKDVQAKLDAKKQEEANDLQQKLASQTKSYTDKLKQAQSNIKSKVDKLIVAQQEVQKDKASCKSGQVGKCFEIIGSGLKMVAANAAYEFALLKKDMIDTIAAIKEVAVKVEADVHQKFLQKINDIIAELDIADKVRKVRLAELDLEVKIVDALTAFSIKQFSIKVLGSDIAKGKVATGILDWEVNFAGKKKSGTWEGAIDFAKPLDYAKNFFNQIGQAITGK